MRVQYGREAKMLKTLTAPSSLRKGALVFLGILGVPVYAAMASCVDFLVASLVVPDLSIWVDPFPAYLAFGVTALLTTIPAWLFIKSGHRVVGLFILDMTVLGAAVAFYVIRMQAGTIVDWVR